MKCDQNRSSFLHQFIDMRQLFLHRIIVCSLRPVPISVYQENYAICLRSHWTQFGCSLLGMSLFEWATCAENPDFSQKLGVHSSKDSSHQTKKIDKRTTMLSAKNNKVQVITYDHKKVTTIAPTNLKKNDTWTQTSKKITKIEERTCKS